MIQINWNVILVSLLYAALTGIFNLLLGHKSQVEAWAESNPRIAALLKLTRAVGFDPWNLISALSLFFTKKLPQAQKADSAIAQTEQRKADAKALIGSALVLLFCCSLPALHGCSLFQAEWPRIAEHCAPSDAVLLADVEAVLRNTADVEAQLKSLAETQGASFVECAVQQAVSDLSGRFGAARDDHALVRGRAFLAKVRK